MKHLKAIHFNLQFRVGEETVPVHTLAELNSCMNINDLYEYFKSGQLARWLKVQEESEKAARISSLRKDADIRETIMSIFDILGLDFTTNEIVEAIDSFLYPMEIEKRKIQLERSLNKVDEIIKKDFADYTRLLREIIEHAEDFPAVKSLVRTLLNKYPEQFKLDYVRFYSVMAEKCPLAIFTVLMEEKWRDYFLPTDENHNTLFYGELAGQFDTFSPKAFPEQVKILMNKFLSLSKNNGNLKLVINGVDMTDSYLISTGIIKEPDYKQSGGSFYDPYQKGQKVMIIHCGSNACVRAYGARGEEISGPNALYKVLDGLEFRTPANGGAESASSLFFMEV